MVATTLLEALTGRATRLDRTRATSRLVELLADRDRLLIIDESQLLTGDCLEVFAHGNLRHWAAFTLSARQLAAEVGRPVLDEQLARNVFALHGGGSDR
ncbi:MAG: hypothetical protein M3417_11945 [Actinomycetota bacterium]|nr:hypothetical protein [Actinomycetota bacterium]